MQKINDLTGKIFGKLTVIQMAPKTEKKTFWICLCECGKQKIVRGDSLTMGNVRSCGCLKEEQDRINLTANHSHKMSGTRLYTIWVGMKNRCYNSNWHVYQRYGARGIRVCDEWLHDFPIFMKWALDNGYSDNLTIDRKDNMGNYQPDNCQWIDNQKQSNNRRNNHPITFNGKTQNLNDWANELNLHRSTIRRRLKRNLPLEQVLVK